MRASWMPSLVVATAGEGFCSARGGPGTTGVSWSVRPIGAPGTLIGLFDDPFAVNETVHLDPGDGMVLFTDGVTDARGPRGVLGDEVLAEVLRSVAGAPADEVVLALEQASIDVGVREVQDDVAILALRVTGFD